MRLGDGGGGGAPPLAKKNSGGDVPALVSFSHFFFLISFFLSCVFPFASALRLLATATIGTL